MKDGFIKIAVISPKQRVANVSANCAEAVRLAEMAADMGVKLAVFPELFLTGATSGDLLVSSLLLKNAEQALSDFIEATKDIDILCSIGLPVSLFDRVYSCAAVVHGGELLGLVPKTFLSDGRIFSSAPGENACVKYAGRQTVFGNKLVFCDENMREVRVACELSSDAYAVVSPSSLHSLAGATVILNSSADYEITGSEEHRRSFITSHSEKCRAVYAMANAGTGESGTDYVFSSHSIIAECGRALTEIEPFSEDEIATCVIDLELVASERRRMASPSDEAIGYNYVYFSLKEEETELTTAPECSPFIPKDERKVDELCERALQIQSQALADRLTRSRSSTMVIGVSGGLDSTLALLVCLRACDLLGWDRERIVAVTMPAFGTSARTKSNADIICERLGVTYRTVDIKKSVDIHLKDIGHDGVTADTTFENAQARERTQVLMDIANSVSGIVVGTGDLSELVLGFATYNGDHMSMYAVNASVPKTLVARLVSYCSKRSRESGDSIIADSLDDIVATPVSPELLPAKEGEIAQKTEEIVGPYELHDYFLYYVLKYGIGPSKLYRMAKASFGKKYTDSELLGYLRIFFRRFFLQQFKRSCLPDGPKVTEISVSPRGELRMPSDADASEWLCEIDRIEIESQNG